MTEYGVFFYTKISAKSQKDLERRVERLEQSMSMSIGRRVYAHGYVDNKELEQEYLKKEKQ